MADYSDLQREIEQKEHDLLVKLNRVFSNSLEEFNKQLNNSMKYIDYITLPIIMASVKDKSFNPFSEIIEKHVSFIINSKMKSIGFDIIPLGYSSDLTFENEEGIVNIDVKTANIENPSDFNKSIALGVNQTTYPGMLPLGIRGQTYNSEGYKDIKVYSSIPEKYSFEKKEKLTYTFGLLFIYPGYKEIIDSVRNELYQIKKTLPEDLNSIIKETMSNEALVKFINHRPDNEKFSRREIIINNIIRAYMVHKKDVGLSADSIKKLNDFNSRIISITGKLKEREIRPVAIISLAIPNGLLKPHYDSQIVSGKSFGKSIRYHYGDGKFKGLEGNKSRVVFIHYDPSYKSKLKQYFPEINEIKEKKE